MSDRLSAAETGALLRRADNILLLTHYYPDGDTLGSAFALCYALQRMGKAARVECSDDIPVKYAYLYENLRSCPRFDPAFICAVDVADVKLLGETLSVYADKIDLCIDHHASNMVYASKLFLRADYAATAMLVAEVIQELAVPFDKDIASCIYTGIATDTGCFKYSNTTAYTLRMAADMLDCGINSSMINRMMFDVKTRARVELERLALESMCFYCDNRCAVMVITNEMIRQSGATESDMEGLAPIPRQIEGVWVGVTLREKQNGSFKVSVRTGNHADASAICGQLNGGGHLRAAGCTVDGSLNIAIETILKAVRTTIE
jgi:phosphoesterase RecJ-like protein